MEGVEYFEKLKKQIELDGLELTEDEYVTFSEAIGPFDIYGTLDEVIEHLKKLKEKGSNVYTYFSGKRLYSMFDNEETCYKKITGMSKAEYDKMKKEEYGSKGKYTDIDILNIKRTAIYFDNDFISLQDAIKFLNKYREAGRNIYIRYHYEKLYSLLDDENSCYEKVIGKSSEAIDDAIDEFEDKYAKIVAKRQAYANEKCDEWIEKGYNFIYPQKKHDWEKCVLECVKSIYHGKEIETALNIMETLDNANPETREDFYTARGFLIDEDYLGTDSSYEKVVDIVMNYSKKGTAFVRFLEPSKSNKKPLKKLLAIIDEDNKKFETELYNKSCDFET